MKCAFGLAGGNIVLTMDQMRSIQISLNADKQMLDQRAKYNDPFLAAYGIRQDSVYYSSKLFKSYMFNERATLLS
jgi:hypothetical protein